MRATILVLLAGCATAPRGPSLDSLTFDLPDLEGRSITLAAYSGKVVLVDIWATWCVPCAESFPFYSELYRAQRDKGFEILAVSIDSETEAVKDFLDRTPVPFKVLRDPNATLPERIGISTMPTAVLIGRDGRVRQVHAGFVAEDREKLRASISEALAESVAVQTSTSAAPGDAPRLAP